jgi:formate dehydrogenase subunit gamma
MSVRVHHWLYAAAFLVLVVTGAVLFLPWTSWSVAEAGQTNRLVHRIAAVVLLLVPLIPLLFARRSFLADVKIGFRWKKDDATALKVLIGKTYWNGDPTGLPPQGKFMAGQKLNILAQTVFFFAMVATGFVLWFGKGVLPQWLMQLSVLVHALSAIGAVVIALVHVYMVTLLPFTKGAIGTMFTGRMRADFARSHHAGWQPESEAK